VTVDIRRRPDLCVGSTARALALAAVMLAGAVLTISPASQAARRTTAPGKGLLVYVNLTNTGVNLSVWQGFGDDTLLPQRDALRGQVAYFQVSNLSSQKRSFSVLGKRTPQLSPGGKARFHLPLLTRGAFPYATTLSNGKQDFHGRFVVR
jgi:hypothetical protein